MTSPRILLITRASILVWTEWWMKPISPHTAHYEPFHSWWHLAAFIYWALEVWDSIPVHLILLNVHLWYKNETRDKIRCLNNCTTLLPGLFSPVPTPSTPPHHVLPVCEQLKKINCLRQKVRGKKITDKRETRYKTGPCWVLPSVALNMWTKDNVKKKTYTPLPHLELLLLFEFD